MYLLTGTLSGQSAASVLHPQQTLPAPGSIPETGPNQLLQPVKPSPSSDNVYSAFTSDGAISVPSLSAPGQGESHEQPPSSESLEMETQPHAGQKPGAGRWLGGAADLEPAAHRVLWAVRGVGSNSLGWDHCSLLVEVGFLQGITAESGPVTPQCSAGRLWDLELMI